MAADGITAAADADFCNLSSVRHENRPEVHERSETIQPRHVHKVLQRLPSRSLPLFCPMGLRPRVSHSLDMEMHTNEKKFR